jgi:hypothetical protein
MTWLLCLLCLLAVLVALVILFLAYVGFLAVRDLWRLEHSLGAFFGWR